MQINWFVIVDSDHLGPFSADVLRELYQAGDIFDETLIWKEGLEEPISYKVAILTIEQEEIPPLPLESTEGISNNRSPESSSKFDDFDTNKVVLEAEDNEPLNTNIKNSYDRNKEFEIDIVEEDSNVAKKELEEKVAYIKKNYLKFVISLISLFVLSIMSYYIYFNYVDKFKRPAKMSLSEYQRLLPYSQNKSEQNIFGITLSEDRSTLWIVTNNSYEGRVVLKLRSLKDKILSNKVVEVTSNSYLKGKIATFSKFEFHKGDKIYDGYYEVEILTPAKLKKPFLSKFARERKNQFRFIDQMLITSMHSRDFDKALNLFLKNNISNDLVFWEELAQKYETIKAITTQIRDSINNIFFLNNQSWGKNIDRFENEYKNNFGQFFTSFVIENEMAFDEIKNKEFTDKNEVIAYYARLSTQAKEVGVISMETISRLRSFNQFNDDKEFEVFKDDILNQFDSILDDFEEKIELIMKR